MVSSGDICTSKLHEIEAAARARSSVPLDMRLPVAYRPPAVLRLPVAYRPPAVLMESSGLTSVCVHVVVVVWLLDNQTLVIITEWQSRRLLCAPGAGVAVMAGWKQAWLAGS